MGSFFRTRTLSACNHDASWVFYHYATLRSWRDWRISVFKIGDCL